MAVKKFCVLTIGRTGSTSLMHFLEKFDDIALPSRDTDCIDSELLHPERIQRYMGHYAPYADGPISRPQQLLNAFYAAHKDDAYAGFKSMPNRHPNFAKFISRPDIQFITLVRRDIASTVASFLMAMETGSWRRSGEGMVRSLKFDPSKHAEKVLGNLDYVLRSYAMLECVPKAIKLDYESLCDPKFANPGLNEFFEREIKIDDPKPPTSGESYVENWHEFKTFLIQGAESHKVRIEALQAGSKSQ